MNFVRDSAEVKFWVKEAIFELYNKISNISIK